MKFIALFSLIILASCATHRGPASVDGNPAAYDSVGLGNVKATAIKRVENQEVCFDINLEMKNVNQSEAQASNWTLAWVDQNNKYHLIPVTQRNPASAADGGVVVTPYYYYERYTNNFTTCARANIGDVKAIVLTPKESAYTKDGLRLSWQ